MPLSGEYDQSMLGAVIEAALQGHNMTQADLAERLGCSQQAVSKWVTGDTRPPPARIPHLAEELDLDAETLHRLAGYLPGEVDPHQLRHLLPQSPTLVARRLERVEQRLAEVEARVLALERHR